MKIIAAILLLSSCAFGQDKAAIAAAEAACGPREVSFEMTVDESKHPTPVPESGRSMVYVVDESYGTTRVGFDGKWVGALKSLRTYFYAPIDPGEHHFCAIGRQGALNNIVLHELKAEAGTTYYFVVRFVGGAGTNEYSVNQVDPDEGKYLVAGAKFSASHPK